MRILTPAEARQIQHIKKTVQNCDYIVFSSEHDANINMAMTRDNREFWLNILDIVLQANDAMKLAWRNSPSSNLTSEVLDKLRPNG